MLSGKWNTNPRPRYTCALLCVLVLSSATGAGMIASPLSGDTYFVGDSIRCEVAAGVQADSVDWTWLSGAHIGVGRDVSVVVSQSHVGRDSIVVAVTAGSGPPVVDTVGVRVLPYDAVDVWCAGGRMEPEKHAAYWRNGALNTIDGAETAVERMAVAEGGACFLMEPRGSLERSRPTYWTNSSLEVVLPYPDSGYGRVRGLRFTAGLIVACGEVWDSVSDLGGACYWRDGNLVLLGADAPASFLPSDISLAAGAVHIAGSEYVRGGIDYAQSPVLWVDGVVTPLPAPPLDTTWDSRSPRPCWANSEAESIHIYNGEVFVTGTDLIAYEDIAGYKASWLWHDGVKTFLMADSAATNPVDHLRAALSLASFAVGRNGVYAAAWQLETWQWFFWHDGIPRLASEVFGSDLEQLSLGPVAELHGHVFVAGSYKKDGEWQLCYWRNGVRTDLPGGDSGYAIRTICVTEKPDSSGVEKGHGRGVRNRSLGQGFALDAAQIEGRTRLEIRYTLRKPAVVTATILNSAGRRVGAANIGLRRRGGNRDMVDIAELAPGHYTLTLATGEHLLTHSFVLPR